MVINSNIVQRIISSLILMILCVVVAFVCRFLFYITGIILAFFMFSEWYTITYNSNLYRYIGLVLIPVAIVSMMVLSLYDSVGWLLLSFFVVISSVDIMAMFGGKIFAGPKLVPKISPNKTISGFVIGIISGSASLWLLSLIPQYYIPEYLLKFNINLFLKCAILACIAQVSDIFISFIKRKANIKDSGTIIYGHGGVLDRFDSIIFTAPLAAIYLFMAHFYNSSSNF